MERRWKWADQMVIVIIMELVMLRAWLGLKALAWAWPGRAWPRPGPMYVEEVKW